MNINKLLDTTEKSIDKKLELLQQLLRLTLEQTSVLALEDIDFTTFEALLDAKEIHLEELEQMDGYLSSIIEDNQKLLGSGLEAHDLQINQIRYKLDQLTSLGQEIGKLEGSNKERLNQYINYKKEDISSFKKSKQVASKYHQNMSNTHQNDMSYFMDSKK